MVCKMEAQLVHVHVAHTFCKFGANLYAQLVLLNKIFASELSRKFIKGPLLVGYIQEVSESKNCRTLPAHLCLC